MDHIQKETDWTILIYANGNNDLEAEMFQSMLDAEKVGSNSRVQVVIQIGRAEDKLVKLIRSDVNAEEYDRWSGVRRYFVHKGNSELVEDLKRANMAHPKMLYQFIKWGMLTYPAKRYLLILGGHSYDGVGMMTDYSRKAPYIMGYPEMVRALNLASNEMNQKIDLLLLDTCNANSLELIYEFGKEENHAIQNVITHISSGPIQGLPYDQIIHYLQTNTTKNTISVIKEIIDLLPFDLISFEVNYHKLHLIKQLFREKTEEALSKTTEDVTRYQISDKERREIIDSVSNNLRSIIIHNKQSNPNTGSLLRVTAGVGNHLNLLKRFYFLGFAQDNDWAHFNHSGEKREVHTERLLPLKMSREEVLAYISIMNPDLEVGQKNDMLERLYRVNKWT